MMGTGVGCLLSTMERGEDSSEIQSVRKDKKQNKCTGLNVHAFPSPRGSSLLKSFIEYLLISYNTYWPYLDSHSYPPLPHLISCILSYLLTPIKPNLCLQMFGMGL